MSNIPFQTIIWEDIPKVKHPGKNGTSFSKTAQFDGIRVRVVEYESGYISDHWCEKGHIVHCLKGAFDTKLGTGEKITLNEGMTFIVSDHLSSHLSISDNGAKLLIIDGEFLK